MASNPDGDDSAGSIDRLGPSRRFVAHVVCENGPMTRAQIATETGYSGRTVDRATKDLLDAGLLRSKRDPSDLRRELYLCDAGE